MRPVVRARPALMAVLIGLLWATGSVAQELSVEPGVHPGGIATVVAAIAIPPDVDSARYQIIPAGGVRAFGPDRGAAPVSDDGVLRLPFTFGVPVGAAAGTFPLGLVRVDWGKGRSDSLTLTVAVLPRRAVTFRVGAEELTVSPGEVVQVGYRLRNRGNAADTFRVRVDAPPGWDPHVTPATVVLGPGDTAAGTARFMPPPTAARGQEHLLRVVVTGPEVREARPLRTLLVAEDGWLGDVAHVPGTLFVGSSSDGGLLPGIALDAAGEVRPGTRLGLTIRHTDALHPAPALRGSLGGPRLRLSLDAPSWALRAGDVYSASDLLAGTVFQGRGLDLAAERGEVEGKLLLAAPWSYGAVSETGHVVRAEASLGTMVGRFGLKAAGVRRESTLFGARSRAGGSATWSYRADGHDVALEAGLLAVEEGGAGVAGFAGQARYTLNFDGGVAMARLRKVPATTRTGASQGDEAFLSASYQVHPAVTATGWAYAAASPFADGGPYAASRGMAGGARVRLPRAVEAELVGSYRETAVVGGSEAAGITRSIRASLDLPLAAFAVEGDIELGTTAGATTRPYRQVRSGVRWTDRGQWVWLGASYQDLGFGAPTAGVDLSGSVRVRTADIQGGLTARLGGTGNPGRVSFWSATTVPVTRALRLSFGLDHRATAASPWRVSLGASRTIGMPLPLRRHPVLHGLVFEDLDGDRSRGADEPLLSGVPLLLGPLRAATDTDGRFRFHDQVPGDLRLDPGAAPSGLVIPADLYLPTTGYVEVPVIRAASLDLTLFLDRDGDDVMGALEAFADGAVASLLDNAGRTRDRASDARGRVHFGGLAPGDYTLRIHPPATGRAAPPPIEIRLTIAPGAAVTRTIALPLRSREIRMGDGRVLETDGADG